MGLWCVLPVIMSLLKILYIEYLLRADNGGVVLGGMVIKG